MSEKKSIRNIMAAIMPSLLCALLGAFTFCIYIPATSYLNNVNFYSFRLSQLLFGLNLTALIAVPVITILLFTISYILSRKLPRLTYTAEKNKSLLSVVHILFVTLVFCIWLEGSPLSFGLPQLTGETGIFNSQSRAIWDTAIWLVVLTAGVIFWHYAKKHFIFLFSGVCLLLGLGIADAYINRETRSASTDITSNDVLDRAAFHTDDNVLILVLDAMSTAIVKDYIAAHPELELDGFVLFENNMESASSTHWALSSILKGDIFTGGNALEYQHSLYDDPKSMAQTFHTADYDIYASSTLPNYNRYILTEDTQARTALQAVHVPVSLYSQFLVKYMPYAAKNTFLEQAAAGGTVTTSTKLVGGNLEKLVSDLPAHSDELTYRALMLAADQKSSPYPTFHFHHVNGAHMPYTIDRNGNRLPDGDHVSLYGLQEQSAWTLKYTGELLQTLKDNGLYDRMTIVILGDHGDRRVDEETGKDPYTQHASLLIKPSGNSGPLSVSQAPTSNMYLADFIPAIHLNGKTIDEVTKDLPFERQVLFDNETIYVQEGQAVTDLTLTEEIDLEYQYTSTVLEPDTPYSLSDLETEGHPAFPSSFDNGNIKNGWGLRATAETMQVAFQVNANAGDEIDVIFNWSTLLLVGSETVFDPYEITVRDRNSNQKKTFKISDPRQEIQLEGVLVSDDAAVDLEFVISRHPDPDTMQVLLTGIQMRHVDAVDSYDERALDPDTRYSLATKKENVVTATPLEYTNADHTNGWGLRALSENMACSFQVKKEPEQLVDIILAISTSALAGGYPQYEPYDLTVRDTRSGKEQTFHMTEGWTDIHIEGVLVGKDSVISLELSISKYPDPDTMQVSVVEIMVKDPSAADNKMPTVLIPGTRYTLATNKTESMIAIPLDFTNGDFSNGWGIRALSEKMDCSFLVNSSPAGKIDVTFMVSTSALVGGYPEFEPYVLTVRDTVSGKEHEFTMDQGRMEIYLEEVSVADDYSMQFEFSISSYPDPGTMQVSVVEVQIDKVMP